ncbi:putative glutaredoxin protein [Ruegeria phage vB_RpoS-V10]|nr:glutaredoxin [Roseobacter phage DSS3P8]AWY09186.1 putative glutaredoxin protein [Ruegeria phage vB_RpoS-V10]
MEHENVGFTIVRGTFACGWCDKAAALLTERGVAFTVQKLGMADLILKQADIGHPTVPMIFHGVKFIGGFDSLEVYLDT